MKPDERCWDFRGQKKYLFHRIRAMVATTLQVNKRGHLMPKCENGEIGENGENDENSEAD